MPKPAFPETIHELLEQSAARLPGKDALVFGDQRFTYQDLLAEITRVSAFITQHTKQGEVVAVLLPNSPELVVTYFASLKAGCTVLFLGANISDNSLLFQIEKTQPTLLFTEKRYHEKMKRTKLHERLTVLDAMAIPDASQPTETRTVRPDDPSTIMFTSGTTSEPKGVKLLHKNVVAATKNINAFLDWKESDIDVNISALSHSFGLGHIHCIFSVGGTSILFRDAIDLKKILNTIQKEHAITFGAVPAILRLILNNYREFFATTGKNLRFIQTNTSPLERTLIAGITEILPETQLCYYYGLTEASRSTFIILNNHSDKWESVGQASPNVKIEIQDESGQSVPPMKVGEISLHGPHVVQEYWENPVASSAIRDGWLHTGDIGYLDEDGFLYFQGRKDDVINVSGEKVIPEEIEDAARKLPAVKDACAVGVYDALLGEAVHLYVSAVDGEHLEPASIRKGLRKHLERYKVPKHVTPVKEIPKTENGKLNRNKVKELFTDV